jgi:hypothetical protein
MDIVMQDWLMRSCKTGFFRTPVLARLALTVCIIGSGCGHPPYNDVLLNSNGDPIRAEAVRNILNAPDLTDEEQRTALEELGITDDQMIDLLLRGN